MARAFSWFPVVALHPFSVLSCSVLCVLVCRLLRVHSFRWLNQHRPQSRAAAASFSILLMGGNLSLPSDEWKLSELEATKQKQKSRRQVNEIRNRINLLHRKMTNLMNKLASRTRQTIPITMRELHLLVYMIECNDDAVVAYTKEKTG